MYCIIPMSFCSIRYPPFTIRNLKIASFLVVPKIKRQSYFRKVIMLCFIAILIAFGLRVSKVVYCFFVMFCVFIGCACTVLCGYRGSEWENLVINIW